MMTRRGLFCTLLGLPVLAKMPPLDNAVKAGDLVNLSVVGSREWVARYCIPDGRWITMPREWFSGSACDMGPWRNWVDAPLHNGAQIAGSNPAGPTPFHPAVNGGESVNVRPLRKVEGDL